MKVLWLCNIIPSIISQSLVGKPDPYGGWLTGLLDGLDSIKQIELVICFPYSNTSSLITGKTHNISFFGFKKKKNNTSVFLDIIRQVNPDIIHIWGTEFKHTLDMVNAAYEVNLGTRIVINIQGLVSIIGKYHFLASLPNRVCRSHTLKEIIYGNIYHQQSLIRKRGKFEVEAIKRVCHVIGRTDFDEACIKQINPSIRYYFCNESLRDSFYNKVWSFEKCDKKTIFVSQSSHPLKGFHFMLEAMPLILQQFPDAHLYVPGRDPYPDTIKGVLRQNSYQKYLCSLIKKYDLRNKVTFLGQLDENQMCERYLKSNVFVSPSSIENSSNSVCEAMLLGLPVVSSDVGGISSLLTHTKEGYLYQFDAPYMLAHYVCKILKNENHEASRIGVAARERARNRHNKDINTSCTLSIYTEVMKYNQI